jgi:hypothetical protein
MKRQPTTQQIARFLDLHRNNQLDLEPPYQRKSVWSSKDESAPKSSFATNTRILANLIY